MTESRGWLDRRRGRQGGQDSPGTPAEGPRGALHTDATKGTHSSLSSDASKGAHTAPSSDTAKGADTAPSSDTDPDDHTEHGVGWLLSPRGCLS
jgi:hypothetical protein